MAKWLEDSIVAIANKSEEHKRQVLATLAEWQTQYHLPNGQELSDRITGSTRSQRFRALVNRLAGKVSLRPLALSSWLWRLKPEKVEHLRFGGLALRVLCEEALICSIILLGPPFLRLIGVLDADQAGYWHLIFNFGFAILHGISHRDLYKRQHGRIWFKGKTKWRHRAFIALVGFLWRMGIFIDPLWGFVAATLAHLIYNRFPIVPMALVIRV